MKDQPGHARFAAGRSPGSAHRLNRPPVSVKHKRNDPILRAFTATCQFKAPLEDRAELGDEWKRSAFFVFRGSGVKPDEPSAPIDLRPGERQSLGVASPPRNEHEPNHLALVLWEMPTDRLDVVGFGEASADVSLGKHSDKRCARENPIPHSK